MKNKRTINDIVIIIILLAVSISLYFLLNTSNNKNGDFVYVEVNNTEYGTYNINVDREIIIKTDSGENIITIENKLVTMKYASCDNQVCVLHKPISKNKEQIICLPNKVLIEIRSTNENEIDALSD